MKIKLKDIALLGMAGSLLMLFFIVNAVVGDRILPGWNGFSSDSKTKYTGEVSSDSGADEEKGFICKDAKYETYDVVLGDYRIKFDYLKGMTALEPFRASGVVTQDFYTEDMGCVTVTVVPEEWNVDKDRPRTADDFVKYQNSIRSEDIVDIEATAEDYECDGWSGVKYWTKTKYYFGSTGYAAGYDLFHGDDYIYVMAHKSGSEPEKVRNVRIEKIR